MPLNETDDNPALDRPAATPAAGLDPVDPSVQITSASAPTYDLTKSHDSSNSNSMNIDSFGDNHMSEESHDDWANSLVGRWFEVYWDPDGGSDKADEQTGQPAEASVSPQPEAMVEKQQNNSIEITPQSQEPKPQIQKNNVLYTGSRLGLSLQQIHIPNTAAVDPSALNIIKQHRTLLNKTAPLSYVVIKTILPDAANRHLLQVNDIVTGINGNSFYSPEFQAGGGGDFFNRVVSQLRDAKRPMVVNFERVILPAAAANDASPGVPLNTNIPLNYRKPSDKDLAYPAEPAKELPCGWTLRRIPRAISNNKTCDIYYYSPQQNFKFRSRPEVSRFLGFLQQTNGNEVAAIGLFRDQATLKQQISEIDDDIPLDVLKQRKKRLHESDSEEEEEECDAVDWYDAKILSYSNGEFVIFFLGDDEGVTYTMPLTREVVRPSVRAWATRTRALLDWNLDLSKGDDIEFWTSAFKSSLPLTTDLPGDLDKFTTMYNEETNNTIVGRQKICEYKRMVALQRHLAKRISPANDEAEEAEEEEEPNGPGPFASAFDVKSLCRYLTEVQDACDWLLSEDIAWTILKLSAETTEEIIDQTKLSKEVILSFMINGAKVLHRLLRADPASARKTSGRKKQRLNTTEGITVDDSFNVMLQSAFLSDTSMDAVIANVTSHFLEISNPKCMDSAIRDLVDQAYSLWKPISNWIKTAEDIVGRQSQNRYSISTIEQLVADAESIRALRVVDISSMIIKLGAIQSRLQQFEMEAWSAIKACIQLNVSRETITSAESVNVVGSNDACYAALQRLKSEASMHPIKNISPLGKAVLTTDGYIPSPLTRTVIADAITIRLWILDLMQAKLLRERSSFIEDVIRRFSALPKLPTPPFGGFDGADAQPSAVLTENTKDSITILSANCYSYNHIIGTIGANLRSSVNANDYSVVPQNAQLTTKAGIAAALVELKRLPILSVVEEKLSLRDELIDWNERASAAMKQSTDSKLPHTKIENLHNELVDIIDLKSDGRRKLCQNLRSSKSVDSEVHLFAVDDEKVVCAQTGVWVREQYVKAYEWKKKCALIIEALEARGFFSNETAVEKSENILIVDLNDINQVWEQHNEKSFASTFPEYERLSALRDEITQWSSKFDQTLTSDALSLQDRCKQLESLKLSRPKGVVVNPTPDSISLWLQVFLWPLTVHTQMKLLIDQFESWKESVQADTDGKSDTQLMDLLKSNMAGLISNGRIFLLSGNFSSNIARLRDEAVTLVCGNDTSTASLSMDKLLNSTCHAKVGLSRVFEVKDEAVAASLNILQVMFWKVIISNFLRRIDNAESDSDMNLLYELTDLRNARALLSLCPRSTNYDCHIIQDRSNEMRLQSIVKDAIELESRANAILMHAADLLKAHCFERKDELSMSLNGLKTLKADFKGNSNASLMLRNSCVEKHISEKVELVTWILKSMQFPILWGYDVHEIANTEEDHRISLSSLIDLHSTIPTFAQMDAEVNRMVSHINSLVNDTKHWQASFSALSEDRTGRIVDLSTIKVIAQSSIISMVIFPNKNDAVDLYKKALLMKEGLETKLLTAEKPNSHDVYKGKFPTEESLVGDDGDFLLFRLTGSLIYIQLRRALKEVRALSDQLTVTTAEKAAYLWMVSIDEWIETLSAAVVSDSTSQLVITVEDARKILQDGRDVLYGVADEVQDSLALKQISIRANPNKYSIVVLKGGAMTSTGGSLLRWAALLFEGLRADVKRESVWRESANKLISSFPYYEQGGSNISAYIDDVNALIDEAKGMFVRDGKAVRQLSFIVEKVMQSVTLKRRLDDEVDAAERERLELEKRKYEGPPLVDERFNLLDGLVLRVSCVEKEGDELAEIHDADVLFAGEQSSRDKSRHFLQKSLLQGFSIFGLENHQDSLDYSNILAWSLEQAIFDKFKTDDANASSEYRDKVRSLRYNLQDPKNPMLCARVISGNLKLEDLINMSTDELASKELNSYRRQVQQEATRNVVLAGPTNGGSGPAGAARQGPNLSGNDWAKRVNIESSNMKRSMANHEDKMKGSCHLHSETRTALHVPPPPVFSSSSSSKRDRNASQSSTSGSSIKIEPAASSSRSSQDSHDHGRHVTSQTGSDSFTITIPRLRLTFTTKLCVELTCSYQIDNFLPSSLTEKGRITLDEFNKFVSDKMKSGRWNIVHLKLSYITGEANMTAYKRLYKEYESLDRICMINVTDSTKVFLVTPKFLRVCKCMSSVQNLSRSSTYAVILTKDKLY